MGGAYRCPDVIWVSALVPDARRVEDLVVVVDDERFSEHGLERAGEPPLGAPGQVVLVVAPLGPLREARDVVGAVLVAQDPDGLARLSRRISRRSFSTSPPRPGMA